MTADEVRKIIDSLTDEELMTPGVLDEKIAHHVLLEASQSLAKSVTESQAKSIIDKLDWMALISSFTAGFVSYLVAFGYYHALSRGALQLSVPDFAMIFLEGVVAGILSLWIGGIFLITGAALLGMLLYQWKSKRLTSVILQTAVAGK